LEVKHTSAVTCLRARQCMVLDVPRVLGVSGGYDQSVRVWDLKTGLQVCEFKVTNTLMSLCDRYHSLYIVWMDGCVGE
jgi:WD40 repeat protein